MIKQILAAGATVAFLAVTAHAADVEPLPEAFDWSSFYIGATTGYVWGDADFDIDPTGEFEGTPAASVDVGLNPDGFIGGLKLGWNSQVDSFVFGLEADISYVDADDDEELGGAIPDSGHIDAELSWLGTLRARAGFALDHVFIYATGGLAVGDWDVEASTIALAPGGTSVARFEESEWQLGWVAGGGIEFAIDDAWSVNAEYLYIDFGKIDGDSVYPPPAPPGFTHDHEVDLAAQIVRAGITYRFP